MQVMPFLMRNFISAPIGFVTRLPYRSQTSPTSWSSNHWQRQRTTGVEQCNITFSLNMTCSRRGRERVVGLLNCICNYLFLGFVFVCVLCVQYVSTILSSWLWQHNEEVILIPTCCTWRWSVHLKTCHANPTGNILELLDRHCTNFSSTPQFRG